MADQCIVCLENLDVESPAAVAGLVAAVAPPDHSHPSKISTSPAENSDSSVAAQHHSVAVEPIALVPATPSTSSAASNTSPKHENHDHVAQIQVCGHLLHDSCLQMWTEKANSCPICRQSFNLVHVFDKVGGKLLTSRTVEDKKQVAEFDPQPWLAESPAQVEEAVPCPLCNQSDREEVLLLCDSCDTPYHTDCIGLDDVPDGSFYCFECSEALGVECINPIERPSSLRARVGRYYFPRTQANQRRARQQALFDEWHGAWGRITGQIWNALSLDLDYQVDDDPMVFEGLRRSQQLRERERLERLEHQQWQQRLHIASRLGAREVFVDHMPAVLGRRAAAPASRPPVQEPREVQLAWGALDRARELESRKRSRSATAEPNEPQHEPERKLKRPRTRRLPHTNGESSSSAANNGAGPASHHADHPSPAAGPANSTEPPSFLSSLLKEVEMSTPSDEDKIQAIYGRIPGVNDASSPGPSLSRASSITPPPHHSTRPGSPHMTLSSHIEPIYPRANYSPTRSSSPNKTSRSSSPKRPARESRSSPENSDTERRGHPNGTSELRQPRPRRTQTIIVPRTENKATAETSRATSPLPLEVKEVISRIVRAALSPHWHANKMTSEQYANINRDISRKLYDQVRDPSEVGDDARQTWEKLATSEVARAVAALGA